MEQTVSKTFGMTLRIEVDPENDDLLSKYLDPSYIKGTIHYHAAKQSQGAANRGGHAGRVMRRAGLYVQGLTVDHKCHNDSDCVDGRAGVGSNVATAGLRWTRHRVTTERRHPMRAGHGIRGR